MKQLFRTPCLVAVVTLLTACATPNVGRDYAPDGRENEGLVVLSLSHEGIDEGERVNWHYRSLDGSVGDRLLSSNLRDPLDWRDPQGRLAFFTLPPGKYEFYRAEFLRQSANGVPAWSIGAGGAPTNSNPYSAGFNAVRHASFSARPFSVPFEVVGGKAIYLGNLHLVWSDQAGNGKAVVMDRAARDLGLLRERLPNIELADIRRDVGEQQDTGK